MKSFDTLTTILVLGILSSTTAQEKIPSGSETTAEETSRIDIDDTDDDTGTSSISFAIPINFNDPAMIEDCQKNGGPTAYSTLVAGASSYSNCTERLVNSMELEFDRTDNLAHNKWDETIAKYCHKLPAFLQCVNPLADLTEPCLTLADREIFKSNKNTIISMIEYLCQNGGNRTASFFTNGGYECMESKRETLRQKCPVETPGSDADQPAEHSPRWIPLVGVTNCTRIEIVGTCTVQVMRTCENPIPANVLESMLDFLKRKQSCPSISAVAQTT